MFCSKPDKSPLTVRKQRVRRWRWYPAICPVWVKVDAVAQNLRRIWPFSEYNLAKASRSNILFYNCTRNTSSFLRQRWLLIFMTSYLLFWDFLTISTANRLCIWGNITCRIFKRSVLWDAYELRHIESG